MASQRVSRPVTIQDALIFVSKRAEDNVKRLSTLEKTLEEVVGEEGGEQALDVLRTANSETGERVDNLLNRVTNLENKIGKTNKKKEKNDNQMKLVLEQFSSLREEFERLEELVHKSNQVDLLVTEDDEEEEAVESD